MGLKGNDTDSGTRGQWDYKNDTVGLEGNDTDSGTRGMTQLD